MDASCRLPVPGRFSLFTLQVDFLEDTIARETKYTYLKWYRSLRSLLCPSMSDCKPVAAVKRADVSRACQHRGEQRELPCYRAAGLLLIFTLLMLGAIAGGCCDLVSQHQVL
jgi:hypothetical protein